MPQLPTVLHQQTETMLCPRHRSKARQLTAQSPKHLLRSARYLQVGLSRSSYIRAYMPKKCITTEVVSPFSVVTPKTRMTTLRTRSRSRTRMGLILEQTLRTQTHRPSTVERNTFMCTTLFSQMCSGPRMTMHPLASPLATMDMQHSILVK